MTQQDMNIRFVDGIGIFENFVKEEFCDQMVQTFEHWYAKKLTITQDYSNEDYEYSLKTTNEGDSQFPESKMGRSDKQLYLEVADTNSAVLVNGVVGSAFELYSKEYKGILEGSDPVSSWTVKLQKTEPGGGYHRWHCENGAFMYRDRVLTWMLYLNDVPYECGGGTDFLHQKLSLQPKKGTMVMWPACYTHMHRGAFLSGDAVKYIATGWFLREPGNVTDTVLSGEQKDSMNG